MNGSARPLLLLTALVLVPGFSACRWRGSPSSAPSAATVEPLVPSPRLVLGRIIAVDPTRGLAHVELAADAAPAALAEGTELIARTDDLRETARLKASRYFRGRTLGTTIARGHPAPGNEVVWLAP